MQVEIEYNLCIGITLEKKTGLLVEFLNVSQLWSLLEVLFNLFEQISECYRMVLYQGMLGGEKLALYQLLLGRHMSYKRYLSFSIKF